MQLIAAKSFFDATLGRVVEGEVFEEPSSRKSRDLIARGIARELRYQTKVIIPEVKPVTATPFRDMPPADEEPPALAALVDAVRAVSDVPEQGNSSGLFGAGCGAPDSAGSAASAPYEDPNDRSRAKRRVRSGKR